MADDSGAAGARAARKQRSQRRGRTFYCGVPEENGAGRHTFHVRLADRCGNRAAILILTLMAGREKMEAESSHMRPPCVYRAREKHLSENRNGVTQQ
ncbi:hypothetical protein [Herbaspirillum rubrisubalbicans]|uniref:hypothetical protein n=1 Tax=Herbaspirillum rubrisubalbicans TaxID=80842 RepID=UPI0012E3C95C|nr:hypothetical protein [Herbaspirillum rubrisubalbicans]